nr:hypothetical protein [Deinobacterium chartae]
MNALSLILGIIAAIALLLGILPLFGWTLWILTVPAGIIGLILGLLSGQRTGVTLNVVVLAIAALRLFLGGGLL